MVLTFWHEVMGNEPLASVVVNVRKKRKQEEVASGKGETLYQMMPGRTSPRGSHVSQDPKSEKKTERHREERER